MLFLLKINMASDLAKIYQLIQEIKDDLKTKATEKKLVELRMEIREKNANIEILESKIAILENNLNLLTTKCDNNEQYTRRVSLRINDILLPVDGKESADQCMHKAKDVIAEAGI